MTFKEKYQDKVVQIDKLLMRYCPAKEGHQSDIMDAMEYNLLAGGKRIRPMLMQEVYHLFGGTEDMIEPFMAAIEMIHTYSLVHDDLPAMDNDDYRRGRKTTHIVYGEDMAILTGDALLNYAFETASTAFDLAPEKSFVIGKALQVLSKKAGIYGMIGGQVVDVKSTGKRIDAETLDFIYKLKTAALIEASMMIGAILAGASDEEVKVVEKIAEKVGLSFQIQDDILDVESTAEVLGKPIHSDEKNDKMTYVTWKGLKEATKVVEQMSKEAVSMLESLHPSDDFLKQLLLYLIHREK